MYSIDDIVLVDDIIFGQNPNEILLIEITIDIVGNVSALCRNQEFFSFISFLFNKVVQDSVYNLLRFAESIQGTGINNVNSSWLYTIY